MRASWIDSLEMRNRHPEIAEVMFRALERQQVFDKFLSIRGLMLPDGTISSRRRSPTTSFIWC